MSFIVRSCVRSMPVTLTASASTVSRSLFSTSVPKFNNNNSNSNNSSDQLKNLLQHLQSSSISSPNSNQLINGSLFNKVSPSQFRKNNNNERSPSGNSYRQMMHADLGVNGDEIVAECGGLTASQIPRTGPKAGRSVLVTQTSDLGHALRVLNSINQSNRVRHTAMSQTKYEKPGKRRQRIEGERKKRKFNMGIKRLFEMVADARRKGY